MEFQRITKQLPPDVKRRELAKRLPELQWEFERFDAATDADDLLIFLEPGDGLSRASGPRGTILSQPQAAWVTAFHSMLVGSGILTRWRTAELARSVLDSCESGRPVVCATLARAALETGAAFLVKTHELDLLWAEHRDEVLRSEPDPLGRWEVPDKLQEHVAQRLLASRRKTAWEQFRTEGTVRGRTSGETKRRLQNQTSGGKQLRDAASLIALPSGDVYRMYEALCDVVHPSKGTFEAYIDPADTRSESADLLARFGRGGHGLPVQLQAVEATRLALHFVERAWPVHVRATANVSVSARLFERFLPAYTGAIREPDPYATCPCGSGTKYKWCEHPYSSEDWAGGSDHDAPGDG